MAKLSEQFVSRLTVPKGKRDVQAFDDSLPGFGVRKFASGRAFWIVKYNVGRKQRKRTLGPVLPGSFASKRKVADEILTRARLGQDTAAEGDAAKALASRVVAKVGELVPKYLKRCETTQRPSTAAETKRYVEGYWARLHKLTPREVTRPDIVAGIDDIEAVHGAVTADRARVALSGFFAWAIDRGFADANPALGIGRRAPPPANGRVLSEPELVAIWRAAGDDDYGKIIRLLILTGQRRDEIGGLDRPEVNRAEKQIELPPERTKNNRPHVVPLAPQALEILSHTIRIGNRTQFFGLGEKGFSGWSKAKARLDKRLPAEMPAWTVHDIRRAVATRWGDGKFAAPHVVEAILNHVSGHKAGVAGTYNKALYLAERRRALSRWAKHFLALVERDAK
jgi:integrase